MHVDTLHVNIKRHTTEQHERYFSENCYVNDNIIFIINTETIVFYIFCGQKKSNQKNIMII